MTTLCRRCSGRPPSVIEPPGMEPAPADPLALPDAAAVVRAAERIAPHVHRTPVFTSATLDRMAGAALFFKAENLQKGGAFKARGAANAVLSLSAEEAARGVLTHSSGNHGAALALAARARGIPCRVVMPEDAPRAKREAVAGYGADIVLCAPTGEAREETARRLVAESGATLVHPYDDPRVIAGQGTAVLELLDQVGALDLVVVPVGGGGLSAGTGIAVAGMAPGTRVVGAEPAAADDAARSLAAGRRLPNLRARCGRWPTGSRPPSPSAPSGRCAPISPPWSRSTRRRSSPPCAWCGSG